MAAALALGAAPVFAGRTRSFTSGWRERRDRFPEGVASGDPHVDSVVLWTRWQADAPAGETTLTVELAHDPDFKRIVAVSEVPCSARTDWTCRVLVGGLRPSRFYWFRFCDPTGAGSRIGRTRTAPASSDPRPVSFAFVSCQNVNLGPLTAWRRMLFDDARAPAPGIEFILHLGDFVYDSVWYPEDRPNGYFDRRPRRVVDYANGERIDDFHVPTTVTDYRALYRAYLRDPDLQDARARWPFVSIWDNGEFSDKGWQGIQFYDGVNRPAQTRKVAANQAWYEYMPARVRSANGPVEVFAPPVVEDRPVSEFDDTGLGIEPDNLSAIGSLTGYRRHSWGPNVDLILTDQRSYRSEDYTAAPEAKAIASKRFPQMVPMETLQKIDAGRAWSDGNPTDRLRFGDGDAPNWRRDRIPRTLLGREQKAWFLNELASSTATWKIWANTVATLDMRADPQHLPPGVTSPWPGEGYAGFARTDHSTAYSERAEIYDLVAGKGIAGFVTLSGDRHSFWAGLSAKSLPPSAFDPVGINFVTGSISSPGMVEALEYILPKPHPLRVLYLVDRPGRTHPEASVNLLLKHGVRSCLDYAAHSDLTRAKALTDPGNAPHVAFVDMAGHGYGLVSASAERFTVEFVCIPRPVEPSATDDGGPLRYRVVHTAKIWKPGGRPVLTRSLLTGDAGLSA